MRGTTGRAGPRLAPRRRRSALVLVAVLLSSLVAALPSSAQSGAGPARPLGPGTWRTLFFIEQTTGLGGVDVRYTGHGSAILEVSETDQVAGEWNLSLRTVILGEAASANAEAIGTVSGDGFVQTLAFDRMTATDSRFGIEVSFTAEELAEFGETGAGSLSVLGVGCDAVTGIWVIPFNDAALTGNFISQRLGSGEPDNQADLRDEGLRLIEESRQGRVDPAELRAYVAAAEAALARGTVRSPDCPDDDARVFSHAGTLMLDTVLVEAGFALDTVEDREFVELYRMLVRSGLLMISDDVRLRWEFEFSTRLAASLSSDDIAEWRFWQPVAEQFGEDSVAEQLATLICRAEGHVGCG